MNARQKLKFLNVAGHLSIVILSTSFLISFFLAVLPRFPALSAGSTLNGWFTASWNLPGPLMFISVFRIQALRVIHEKTSGKKYAFGITWWVKFWFYASVVFGLVSLAFLVTNIGAMTMPAIMATVVMAALWVTLVASTLVSIKMTHDKGVLDHIERARKFERTLLVLTSVVFLVFTGYPSITVLMPGA